jgi:hypothetical protein
MNIHNLYERIPPELPEELRDQALTAVVEAMIMNDFHSPQNPRPRQCA